MPTFYHQTQYEMDQPPPSYGKMIASGKARVKAKVKRAMPRIRGKVAELGKAKVAEKKAQAVSLEEAAGKMDGRVKTKRVKEEKKAKAKVKAKVRRKMPRIRQKVADLGASKVREKVKVGKGIEKITAERDEEGVEVIEMTRANRGSLGSVSRSIFNYLDHNLDRWQRPQTVYYDELTGTVHNFYGAGHGDARSGRETDEYELLGTYNNNVFRPNKKIFK